MVTELYERIQEGLEEKQQEITEFLRDRARDGERGLSLQ